MKARLRRWFNRVVLDRHEDGTRHTYTEAPLGAHACEAMSYCHHDRLVCPCGRWTIVGYAVEEVR